MGPEGISPSPQPEPELTPLEMIRRSVEALEQERNKIKSIGNDGYYELVGTEKYVAQHLGELILLNLEESPVPVTPPVPQRSVVRQKYRELSEWNREGHNRLIEMLEPVYCGVAGRINSYAINHQEELGQMASQLKLFRLPYSIASLPPNLFDHWKDGRPHIPTTDAEIAQLVGEYCVHHHRLRLIRLLNLKEIDARAMYGQSGGNLKTILAQGMDIAEELQRRRKRGDPTFETETGQREWRRYNEEYKRRVLRSTDYKSLLRNALFISYGNNIRFSEVGGFFDSTDGKFDSFLLADFMDYFDTDAYSRMTISQIRTPIGHYGFEGAENLTRGTYLMMKLMVNDEQFAEDRERLARDARVRTFLQNHLMRVLGRKSDEAALTVLTQQTEMGILDTGLEGILSVNGLASAIEADGIPGHTGELWSGITTTVETDAHVKLTSIIPEAIIGPMAIHGDYFRNLMIRRHGTLLARPAVVRRWQAMQDRRTDQRHADWLSYYQSDRSGRPPIRFALHCPFKGPVVREFTKTLMVCRAIAA